MIEIILMGLVALWLCFFWVIPPLWSELWRKPPRVRAVLSALGIYTIFGVFLYYSLGFAFKVFYAIIFNKEFKK